MLTGISISLSPTDRVRLVEIASDRIGSDRNSPQKHVWRAQIVLLSADGVGTNEIMRVTDTSKTCVWRWQRRFMEAGIDGLLVDKTRPSRIPPLGNAVTERVVALTLTEPLGETTHWTAAAVAAACSISVSSVHRIWRSHGLRPHQIRQFKLFNDPQFAAKVRDIVGLYVNPPEHAVVLSVDEKSQIQALDRTQPGLPLKKGRCGTMTHDYKRNGTTTLFAAFNVLEGSVIGRCMQRHTTVLHVWTSGNRGVRLQTPIVPRYERERSAVRTWETAMARFVGLDVSQKLTSVCVVDETGRRIWRGQCSTDPTQLERIVKGHAGEDARVGLETGPMTPWLVHALLAPKGSFSNRISYVNWFLLLCVAEPGSGFSPRSAFAAATSGPKRGRCDVHNGLTCTHAAQRPPSQSARTLVPEGNSHSRQLVTRMDCVVAWLRARWLLGPTERLA